MYISKIWLLVFSYFIICASGTSAKKIDKNSVPNAIPYEVNVSNFLQDAQGGQVYFSNGETTCKLILKKKVLSPAGAKTFIITKDKETEVYRPAPYTFAGTVEGYPESRVCLTISSDRSWIRGYLTYKDVWINIQPEEETAIPGRRFSHYIHHIKNYNQEIERQTLLCSDLANISYDVEGRTCHVQIIGDTEYYNLGGGHWYDRMVAHINYVSDRMDAAIGVTLNVSSYKIDHTLAATTNSNTLVDKFKEAYLQMTPDRRQLVHLLSGRYFSDGTFGRSKNGLGRTLGYSIAQMVPADIYDASDHQRMLISLHEIGHNFTADHPYASSWFDIASVCAWTAYSVMNPKFYGYCTAWSFSAANIERMNDYANNALSNSLPIISDFEIENDSVYTQTRDVRVSGNIQDVVYVWALSHKSDPYIKLNDSMTHTFISEEWTLTAGDGLKEVCLTVAGQNDIPIVVRDSIILDETPPTEVVNLTSNSHNISINSTERIIKISWQAAIDETSGLAGYSSLWTQNAEAEPNNTINLPADALSDSSTKLSDGEWYYVIKAHDHAGWNGPVARSGPYVINTQTDIDNVAGQIPQSFYVSQNYPNPFNPSTIISYGLPQSNTVSIKIYNMEGKLIRILWQGDMPAGRHVVHWDGRADNGEMVSSGQYICILNAGTHYRTMKMILMK